jgi:hypothetical protein
MTLKALLFGKELYGNEKKRAAIEVKTQKTSKKYRLLPPKRAEQILSRTQPGAKTRAVNWP